MEWVKAIVGVLGGGAVGAIITNSITNYRNRIQPIGKRVKVESIFAPNNLLKGHLTKITFSGETENFHYDNLYLIQIELQNEGNKDYQEFNFGVTLPSFGKAVNIKAIGKDRHHLIETKQIIDFNTPSNILDCTLKPFNRKDKYSISLYVTCEGNNIPSNVIFSSNMPVRFNEIETFTGSSLELAFEILKRIVFFTDKKIGI